MWWLAPCCTNSVQISILKVFLRFQTCTTLIPKGARATRQHGYPDVNTAKPEKEEQAAHAPAKVALINASSLRCLIFFQTQLWHFSLYSHRRQDTAAGIATIIWIRYADAVCKNAGYATQAKTSYGLCLCPVRQLYVGKEIFPCPNSDIEGTVVTSDLLTANCESWCPEQQTQANT